MASIQDRLNKLQPYVVGIRYTQGMTVVDVLLKEKWVAPKSEIIKFEKVDNEPNYYMFYSLKEDIGVDELLDYIGNIIKLNLDNEEKLVLFKTKVKELQDVFKLNELAKLKTLKFTFGTVLNGDIGDIVDISDDEIDINESLMIKPDNQKQEAIVEPPKNSEKVIPSQKQTSTPKNKHGKIELPPKGPIKLEDYNLPEHETNGDCNCGPNEACPKCMDSKDM